MATKTVALNRIRDLRGKRGLSQEALARRAKVSMYTISAAERGVRVPQVVTQEKIARALRVTREDVFPEPAAAGSGGTGA